MWVTKDWLEPKILNLQPYFEPSNICWCRIGQHILRSILLVKSATFKMSRTENGVSVLQEFISISLGSVLYIKTLNPFLALGVHISWQKIARNLIEVFAQLPNLYRLFMLPVITNEEWIRRHFAHEKNSRIWFFDWKFSAFFSDRAKIIWCMCVCVHGRWRKGEGRGSPQTAD